MILLLLACDLSSGTTETADTADTSAALTCDEIEAAYQAEYTAIAACDTPADCGQIVRSDGCGCTYDLVARNDADTTRYDALFAERCGPPVAGACDCPATDGFACTEGQCAWNYTSPHLVTDFGPCDGLVSDPFELAGAAVVDGRLIVDVSYAGGCRTHAWNVCWSDQTFQPGDPVRVGLTLVHDDHAEWCEEPVMEAVDFDLVRLRRAWEAAYGVTSGTVRLDIDGRTVTYTF